MISYEGKTIEKLEQDFIENIKHYLNICKAKGITPQRSFTCSFNVRIPPDMHGKAVLKARTQGVSLNVFVKEAIEQKLKSA